MRRLTVKGTLALAILFVLVFWMFSIVTAASNRICVCHIENKETGKGHVIEVDKDSLKGHLNHGDIQCTVDCETVVGSNCNISNEGECSEATD